MMVSTANYPKHIALFQIEKLLEVCPLYPIISPLYPYYSWLKRTDMCKKWGTPDSQVGSNNSNNHGLWYL